MDKKRIAGILSKLSDGVYGREEVIAIAFLGAIAGLNTFLLGPPGTAKSMIARRISSVFKSDQYFELLMHRFSTPEEIFGPIKLSELKKDNYERETAGYLPTADLAFLDEIWKANSAILNTLLMIINEKQFKNGNKQPEDVPLKVLIAASNETPPPGQSLEALYDRFSVRLHVEPIEDKDNFEKIIGHQSPLSIVEALDEIDNEELESLRHAIEGVKLSNEVVDLVHQLRSTISDHNAMAIEREDGGAILFISDRHWKHAIRLVKTHAHLCGRTIANLVDTIVLKYCLWSTLEQKVVIDKIIKEALQNSGFQTSVSWGSIDERITDIEEEIDRELFHTEDIYDTVKIKRKDYFLHKIRCKHFHRNPSDEIHYVPMAKRGSSDWFHPQDASGNSISDFQCTFDKQNNAFTTKLEQPFNTELEAIHDNQQCIDKHSIVTKIEPSAKAGDVITDLHPSLHAHYDTKIAQLQQDLNKTIYDIQNRQSKLKDETWTPFIPGDIVIEFTMPLLDEQTRRINVTRESVASLKDKLELARKHNTK